mmetsp:Transcript_57522/g.123672  ORF Transcript_57522/g.123672 Transcript_57522/m.123672 type:complete len:465 (-) Transcript_57522:35-1429(-)
MFDYDDLEDEPCDLMTDLAGRLHAEGTELQSCTSDLHPTTDNVMRGFASRLQRAEQAKNYSDFQVAIAEALVEPEALTARMPRIIKAFLSLLADVAVRPRPDLEAAAAIIYNLWQLALSTSVHEVRARPGKLPGAPCALILGFGGSGVDDLEEQARWYHDRGFAAISTTAVSSPRGLVYPQLVSIARELRAALGQEGKLVLHMCSHYGVSFGSRILHMWNAGVAPFDDLPPFVERLKAIVFDCGPAPNFDPATDLISYPIHADATLVALSSMIVPPSAPTESQDFDVACSSVDETQADKAHTKLYTMVILGCVGALTKRWDTTHLSTLISKHNIIRKFVQVVARMCSPTKGFQPSWLRTTGSSWALPEPVLSFQALDQSMKMSVPRLFLYSESDSTVPPERIEAYMAHMARYLPGAEILSARLKKSGHCRLWESEPEECAEAASALLDKAGLRFEAVSDRLIAA